MREISFSGGLVSLANVTRESNAGFHYAYTTSGLQQIAPQKTESILPAVTDFLSAKVLEDIDSSTLTISRTSLSNPLNKSVAIIADRYLVISYGYPSLSHAIVYDIIAKRFGKLKIPHVISFEWWGHAVADTDRVKNSLAVLQEDGTVLTVNFSRVTGTYGLAGSHRPLALLGKVQYTRSRLTTLHAVDLENVYEGNFFEFYDLPSLNGKTFEAPVAGTENLLTYPAKTYYFRNTAMNHTLAFKGKFDLVSVAVHISIAGRR
jgi:hypothetical protein